MNPGSILVVRLSAMGDILHALPAVATLKRSFPAAHITWAVKPRWAVLLRDNPHIDRVRGVTVGGSFDLAIDFQGLLKSALVACLARPKRILGFHPDLLRERAAAFFYSEKVHSSALHVVERDMDLAAAAGATARSVEFPIPDCAPEGELPDSPFVLASPFAGWTAKQWPPACYAALARLLYDRHGWPLVINCSPSERDQGSAIAQKPYAVLNVTSVAGLIGVTRRAQAVLGVDSGPLHLAAALRKPGVALFGPTDPARNGPYSPTFTVLRAPDAVTTYRRTNTIAPSMRALLPEQVYRAIEAQISVPEPRR